MGDPYFYEDTDILKNKLNIKDYERLEEAESHYSATRSLELNRKPIEGNFDFEHLKKIHQYIFQDIYEWAGKQRVIDMWKHERVLAGNSVQYSLENLIEKDSKKAFKNLNSRQWNNFNIDEKTKQFSKCIADIWKIHPFREGNTRTVMTFASQFAEQHGFPLKVSLFRKHSEYVRNSLVMSSLGQYSEPKHLERIIKDSMEQGIFDKVIKVYKKDFPAIKHISPETAILLNDLNNDVGKNLTILELKTKHLQLGKQLEGLGTDNKAVVEQFNHIYRILKEFSNCTLTANSEKLEKNMVHNKPNTIDLEQ